MRTPRGGAAAVAVGGTIRVVGGMNGGASLASTETYDIARNTWSVGPTLGTARDNPGAAEVNGQVYVFGGRTRLANGTEVTANLASTEALNPASGGWTPRAAMPTPRRTMAVGVLAGKIVAAGGERGPNNTTFRQSEQYDPATNTWTALAPMTTGRHGAAAAVVAGRLHVIAGGAAGGSSYGSVHEILTVGTTPPPPTPPPPPPTEPPPTTQPPAGTPFAAKVRFATAISTPPAGYLADWGQPYASRTSANQGTGRTYGWVRAGTSTALDLTLNARLRGAAAGTDPRLAGLMHMNATASTTTTSTPGSWELAVPNGTYAVTVSVGDASFVNSTHRVAVEGRVAVAGFAPTSTSPSRFASATVTVPVADGRLTLDPTGGSNTKINYVDVVATTTTTAPPPTTDAFAARVRFATSTSTPPTGHVADWGQPFGQRTSTGQGSGRSYGWVEVGTSTGLDLTRNARLRTGTSTTDPRLIGFVHMNPAASSSTTATPGSWELAVPTGTYTVTVSVGDAGNFFNSTHQVNVEDQNAIAQFTPTSTARSRSVTVTVHVSDGRLTLSPTGGTNVKLNVVDVASVTASPTRPRIASVTPPNGTGGALRDLSVTSGLALPAGGIAPASLTASTAVLTRASDGVVVPSRLNTSAGGDVITLTPTTPLTSGTTYRYSVTSGLRDVSGNAFHPWSSVFTVGTASAGTGLAGVAFDTLTTGATGQSFTSVAMGPDNRLYAATLDGYLFRYPVAADGSLGAARRIDTVRLNAGGPRTIIGLAFDPSSTAAAPVLWVTENRQFVGVPDIPDWTGRIVRLSGADLSTARTMVVGLPRSARDHESNSLAFKDGALYLTQGSNSAMGASDPTWANRPERVLSAAVLRLDPARLPATLPLDVRTRDGGGTYDPFAAGAPLTLYASGVRNAYDLLWHSNGRLYVPTNGSARGGNLPATPATLPSACGNRIDGAWTGPAVPGATNVASDQTDWVLKVAQGGYYGHPNPARCEWASHGANPTSSNDPFETSAYGVGVRPDRNYRVADIFDTGLHASANGTIEYQGSAFGGALRGKIVVVRFSASQDIMVLDPSGPSGSIATRTLGITGFTGFDQPLDLAQHPTSGTIYVTELGGQRITRLVPRG